MRSRLPHTLEGVIKHMIGCIRLVNKKGRGEVRLDYIGPLTVMTAELSVWEGLPSKRLTRHLRRLERTLCRRGIGRVILPEGFPYAERLERLRPVEPLPFYRGMADVLALGWLEGHGILPGEGRVALAAPWLCPELCGAAERLCRQVRELVIVVPTEGECYAGQLHRQFGLPILPPTAETDVTVAFGQVEGLDGKTIRLYGEQPDLVGMELTAPGVEMLEGCSQPLLTLLWEAGALDRSGIRAIKSTQTLANGSLLCYNN